MIQVDNVQFLITIPCLYSRHPIRELLNELSPHGDPSAACDARSKPNLQLTIYGLLHSRLYQCGRGATDSGQSAIDDGTTIRSSILTPFLQIASAPKPRWKQLTHRRLQTWPSDLVQDKLLDAPLPSWLEDPIVPRLQSIPVMAKDSSHIFSSSPHQRPNHVLINEYPPGIGIMPHKLSTRSIEREGEPPQASISSILIPS